METRRKNRLVQVRQQSKDFAQQVRRDVKCEKEQQLKKIQALKDREMNEWRLKTQDKLQKQYGHCLSKLGNAHLDACEASCEESESLFYQREEFDLLAAERGRTAMLQEHRRREREAEIRLKKKKMKLQRDAMVQADLVPIGEVIENCPKIEQQAEKHEALAFLTEPNDDRISSSLESARDLTAKESTDEFESEIEFHQITDLLKQNSKKAFTSNENILRFQSCSDKDPKLVASKQKLPMKTTMSIEYSDFNRKNASCSKSDRVQKETEKKMELRKPPQEDSAMAKEMIRHNYESMRRELEGALMQDNKGKQAAIKALENITSSHLTELEQARKKKITEAVENSLKRNILTCAPVDSKDKNKAKLTEMNVNGDDRPKSSKSGSQQSTNEAERLQQLLKQISQYRNKLNRDFLEPCKQEKKRLALPLQENLENAKLLASGKKCSEERSENVIRQAGLNDSENGSSEFFASHPPIEIIIKVHPTQNADRMRKLIRIDTLGKKPRKTYNRTPKKKSEKNPLQTEKSRPNLDLSKIDEIDRNTSPSTTYQSLPEQINIGVSTEKTDNSKHKLNPDLMPYITRLLGMSINLKAQLSVTTSTATTPGSCTIDTSDNNSLSHATDPRDSRRLSRLQEFISDNYSFLDEVYHALEQKDDKQFNSMQLEKIWKEALIQRKDQPKLTAAVKSTKNVPKMVPSRSQPKVVETLSTFSPPNSRSENLQLSNNQHLQPQDTVISSNEHTQKINHRDMADVARHLEFNMLNNFAQYTHNCYKRIDEIAQTMERVRQEKQKLIENSLSSGEFGHINESKTVRNEKRSKTDSSGKGHTEHSSQREDPPSEEINNILQKQTRPFGVSKDSGISILSRPMTSSDFRDSPEVREEVQKNTFKPILRDLTVHGSQTEDVEAINLNKNFKEQDERPQKKSHKPPLSLNRFSPNLEKPHEPHELSTIAEVETPSASKGNLLFNAEAIEPFPSFTAYEKNHRIEEQHGDENFVSLDDVKQTIDGITMKSFAELNEDNERRSLTSSSSSSVLDIMKELRRRNIMTEPFKYIDQQETHETTSKKKKLLGTAQGDLSMPKVSEMNESQSNDTLSGIQEIEKEHVAQTHAAQKNDSSSSSTSGQPMNLREFLSRELAERSRVGEEKSTNDSSLSSHFMRSLLNYTGRRSSSGSYSSNDREKLRTSTPVHRIVNSTATSYTANASISTLKCSEPSDSNYQC